MSVHPLVLQQIRRYRPNEDSNVGRWRERIAELEEDNRLFKEKLEAKNLYIREVEQENICSNQQLAQANAKGAKSDKRCLELSEENEKLLLQLEAHSNLTAEHQQLQTDFAKLKKKHDALRDYCDNRLEDEIRKVTAA